MKRVHNTRNAQLMAKYGASPELMSKVLDMDVEVCSIICDAHPHLKQVDRHQEYQPAEIEEAIATAIANAHKMREESWLAIGNYGEYTLDDEVCFMVACEQQSLPKRMWYVLSLANHWSNDLADWSECVKANEETYIPSRFVEAEDEDVA